MTVHPRTHGEHFSGSRIVNRFRGSSPYTRGTRLRCSKPTPNSRFIPVHTGNTNVERNFWIYVTVHPRTHGEHVLESSVIQISTRFIPVHTGNTKPSCLSNAAFKVHPRTHGEHVFCVFGHNVSPGSSPYTRGTHQYTQCKLSHLSVHPRTHGEH